MIVIRFRAQFRPEKTEEALALLEDVVAASRPVDGVVSFDIGRDLTDPNTVVAVEVFEDREAMERQEALPETQKVIGALGDLVAAEPEATIFEVSSAEGWEA